MSLELQIRAQDELVEEHARMNLEARSLERDPQTMERAYDEKGLLPPGLLEGKTPSSRR